MTVPSSGSTYAGAGVDIAAGEKAVELIKEHVRSTFRPEVVGDIGGFGGLFADRLEALRTNPLLVSSTDGVGTKSMIARLAGRLRHHRHRLRRDVGRRHRGAGRGAAVLPRLHLDRQARPRGDRRASSPASRDGCRRRGARCSAARCRSIPASWSPGEFDLVGFAVGVVDRDARPAAAASRAGDAIVGLRQPGSALQRLLARARRAPRPRRSRASTIPPGPARTTRLADELLRPA